MATFPRGSGDQRLWAKNRELIDNLSGNGDGDRQRGRWVADPADAWTLRGIPAVGPRVSSVMPGTQPERALLAKERRRERRQA